MQKLVKSPLLITIIFLLLGVLALIMPKSLTNSFASQSQGSVATHPIPTIYLPPTFPHVSDEDVGKFSANLYQKLLAMTDSERLSVSLTLTTPYARSAERKQQAITILLAKYPEKQQIINDLDQRVFGLSDTPETHQILLEYEQLVWGDFSQGRQQVIDALQQIGARYSEELQIFQSPYIRAYLTRDQIQQIAQLDAISHINYFSDATAAPAIVIESVQTIEPVE